MIGAVALVVGFAAPSHAVTQNWPDVYIANGNHVGTDTFNSFLQTHPGQNVYVCVTAKAVGGAMSVTVSTPFASKTLTYFYTSGFSQVCANMYNYSPGWGPVKVMANSQGGNAIYLRQVSIT